MDGVLSSWITLAHVCKRLNGTRASAAVAIEIATTKDQDVRKMLLAMLLARGAVFVERSGVQ